MDADDLKEDLHDPDEDFYARAGLDGNVVLEYVSPKFSTATEVKGANDMLAEQIAKEPSVRKFVRESFFERARFDVIPTKEGLKKINEMHDLYSLKFLKDKPARDLVDDQFLRLWVAEQDKLLTIVFPTKIEGAITASYVDEIIKALLTRDESSKLVQEWNVQRNEIIDLALSKFVLPSLVKELKAKLLNEAHEFVKRACCQQLYNCLNVAPYEVNFGDKEDWDTKDGFRVLGLSYGEDETVYGCLINVDGEFSNQIRLEHILKRKNAGEKDRTDKEKNLKMLKYFISSGMPHAIAVSAESKKATKLVEDSRAIISEFVKENKCPTINVFLVDNSLAKVFAKSTRADFPQDWLFGEAITIARVFQDPLIAYSQLCNADDDILLLKYHPLQEKLSKEQLLEGLYLEFVNRINESGVDINRAIKYPRTAHLLQFICGLGPRKADDLIKTLKLNNKRLENRSQLKTACHMGVNVFTNCAGFIKIDTHLSGDAAESQVEVLDGSRVHPEIYDWARRFAVAALEYHGEKDVDPWGAVKKILEAPERLIGLDVDALAADLERQGFGNKRNTLYDIRSELNHLYKDGRSSYRPPSDEDIFNIVTKETSQTFFIGKMVLATVTGFLRSKPEREELDRANPKKNETNGLWQCPFCLQVKLLASDLNDLNGVWRPPKDAYYDGPAEEAMLKAEKDSKKLKNRQSNTESVVVHPASNTSNTTERRSGGPSSRSRSRSPNRGLTARGSRDHARSRSPLHQSSPLRRPSPRPPALPPVGAPAPALIPAPPWFHNVQCPNFRDHSQCPRGDLCGYVQGPYQPDKDLLEALKIPRRPPQNP
ncbi:hypothetical protein DAPPUDRAFT_57929 [Daphnia pulex]|uniref:Uncharacterized protein n=1 Tax=Daphnia pulex TaxID=6669 RepID=E9H3P9_DAPPU|nr:hypothetical protein DAPPUDRAFT_57929 [Daphnia pulex]|eukprot:EFX73548.1 hypothetical protein DAPPUDRAFT_57929 [Daphnia pulex]